MGNKYLNSCKRNSAKFPWNKNGKNLYRMLTLLLSYNVKVAYVFMGTSVEIPATDGDASS